MGEALQIPCCREWSLSSVDAPQKTGWLKSRATPDVHTPEDATAARLVAKQCWIDRAQPAALRNALGLCFLHLLFKNNMERQDTRPPNVPQLPATQPRPSEIYLCQWRIPDAVSVTYTGMIFPEVKSRVHSKLHFVNNLLLTTLDFKGTADFSGWRIVNCSVRN